MDHLSDFFKSTQLPSPDKFHYTCMKATHPTSTMVLFSKVTNTPLAALVFRASDLSTSALVTGRPSPAGSMETYFQGMLNQSDKEFTFTIINLNPEGSINFNILHTPHRVSEVDPGPAYGVNQVNELHPLQVYTVRSDQRTGKTMILQGIVRPDNTPMDVSTDESTPERRQGSYFYLSVVAQIDKPDLVDKFKEGTVWKCVPFFIQKTHFPTGVQHSVSARCLFGNGELHTLDGSRGFGSRGFGMDSIYNSRERTKKTSKGPRNPIPIAGAACRAKNYQAEEADEADEGSCLFGDAVNVGATQAARVAYGRDVTVQTQSTGLDYCYDAPSDPVVIGLSIFKEMKFVEMDLSSAIDEAAKEIQKTEEKQLSAMVKNVFKTDTCVIDLESPTDTVIVQCGHQCLNSKNTSGIKKCPLCRQIVLAFVPASTFAQ